MDHRNPPYRYILGMRVDSTTYREAASRIATWATDDASRYVCAANVHMAMECYDNEDLRRIVNEAALVTADGMPLVWALQLFGLGRQQRVYGPDLMLHVCAEAERQGLPIGLYGGTEASLRAFSHKLKATYPDLPISCQIAPPFRVLTAEEDARYTAHIVESGARIVFVGIGCPRQELWMAAHRGRIPGVMIGVGAAFDFHSGRVRQAPAWMQRIGMEWFFRLLMEPRRLWKRYIKHNPRFVILFLLQLLGLRRFREV